MRQQKNCRSYSMAIIAHMNTIGLKVSFIDENIANVYIDELGGKGLKVIPEITIQRIFY